MNFFFILIGTSGVGKTTLRKFVASSAQTIKFVPSYTTRLARNEESNGVDYFFISKNEFLEMIKHNKFIEYEEHYGNYYGIARDTIVGLKNYNLIKEVSLLGYYQIKETYKEVQTIPIYVRPYNLESLKEFINERIGDNNLRISEIQKELEFEKSLNINNIITSKKGSMSDMFLNIKKIINLYLPNEFSE